MNGAMEVARQALGIPASLPITMLWFNGKGKRHHLNRCIGVWQKAQMLAGENDKSGTILQGILSAR